MKAILLSMLLVPSVALACGGSDGNAKMTPKASDDAVAHAAVNPEAVTKNEKYTDGCCSYSTGMMAQRVMSEGKAITISARAEEAPEKLDSNVAAPFAADGYRIIANEVLDTLDISKATSLSGKALEVDGVKYLLLVDSKAS